MKTLTLILFGLLYFPFSHSTDHLNYTPTTETIYLDGQNLRQLLSIEDDNAILELCNLVPGKQYDLTILPRTGCAPYIQMKDQPLSKTTLKFTASTLCQNFQISNAGCDDTFSLSITSFDTQNQSPENLSLLGIEVAYEDPEVMVRDVLLGGTCFAVSGVTVEGGVDPVSNDTIGYGVFSNGGTSITLESGIMLSTGDINDAPGPNESTSTGTALDNLMDDTDLADLLDTTTSILRDVTRLEFDFVPTQEVLAFNYVFASEEYCDYVESQYNDVFGFFISGPGIVGNQNIAIIPGSTTPVAINNVNWSDSSAYYVDNVPVGQFQDGTGCTMEELNNPAASDDIEFDGFTVPLTAVITGLIPCEQYHIKLAIADVGDQDFDSAVFLEANSFDAGGDVDITSNSPVCAGSTIELFASPSSCTSDFTYSWTGPDGFESNEQNPTIGSADPAKAGTYTVVVTDGNGCLSMDTHEVVVGLNPLVGAGAPETVCGGGILELIGSATGGTPPYFFSWTGPDGFESNEQNPVLVDVAPINSGTYTVSVIDSIGCTNSASVDVSVTEFLSVANSNNGPICAGATLELMATPSGGTGPFTYNWIGPDGFESDEQNPAIPDATTDASGFYTVFVTDANGCENALEAEAIVNENPTVVASSDSTVCGNSSFTLSATPSGGEPDYTYSWTGPDGFESDEQNPSVVDATPANSGTYTVVVTDANGCTATADTETTVTDALFVDNTNNGPVCEGATLKLFAEPTGGTGPYTYSWIGPNGFESDEQNPTIPNAPAAASGFYTVFVTDVNGCENAMEAEAIVFPGLEANSDSNSPICQGETLQLSSSVMGGEPDYTYSWTGPNGFESDEQNPEIADAQPAASGTYTVVITDANGCSSTSEVEVTVHENPIVTADNNSPICAGEDLELYGDAELGTPDYTYEWDGPNGFMSDEANPTIPNATTDASGTYNLKVTDSNGCTATASTEVTVWPNPTITADSNSPICEGDHLFFTTEVSGGTEPYTYQWDRIDGVPGMSANPSVFNTTMDDAGTYMVTVTDANGCTAEASTDVVILENITDAGTITGDQYFCGPGYDPAPITSVTPATGPGPIEYFWMKNTASSNYWEVIPGATGASYNPPVIYETTVYSRCARRVGCQMALESNMVTITVGTEAMAYVEGPSSACVGDPTVYSAPMQAGATYSWDFGSGASPQYSNAQSVTVTWNSMGVRTIQLSVTTATCTAYNNLPVFISNSTVYCNWSYGIPEENLQIEAAGEKAAEPEVYPNPFTDQLNVALNQVPEQGVVLQLTDLNGRLIETILSPEGTDQVQLDLAKVPSGLYVLTINMGTQGVYFKKILKE